MTEASDHSQVFNPARWWVKEAFSCTLCFSAVSSNKEDTAELHCLHEPELLGPVHACWKDLHKGARHPTRPTRPMHPARPLGSLIPATGTNHESGPFPGARRPRCETGSAFEDMDWGWGCQKPSRQLGSQVMYLASHVVLLQRFAHLCVFCLDTLGFGDTHAEQRLLSGEFSAAMLESG